MKNMIAMTNGATLLVDVQEALEQDISEGDEPPSASQLSQWAEAAHLVVNKLVVGKQGTGKTDQRVSEVTLRLVDEAEMIALNTTYRGKAGSTNVLSFPVDNEFDLSVDGGPSLLGDIVICHRVITREAAEQNKTILNHYAHMVTHGVLHLHGYDHLDDQSAEEMEALEANILSRSGIENPYN